MLPSLAGSADSINADTLQKKSYNLDSAESNNVFFVVYLQ